MGNVIKYRNRSDRGIPLICVCEICVSSADSKEAAADEMQPLFEAWASEPGALTAEQMRDEYIEGLEAVYVGPPRIVFDNGGGAIFQLNGYCHHYDDMSQMAIDIDAYLDDDDVTCWDESEEESAIDPGDGYVVMGLDVFMNLSIHDILQHSWRNVKDLYFFLTKILLG